MDNNTMSPADIAAMTNGSFGGNEFLWIFALLILFGGGNFGFGNGTSFQDQIAAAQAANGGMVTNGQMNDAFNFAALERQNNETVAAVNQAKYDNINVMKDIQSSLQMQLSNLGSMEQAIGDKMQECCCSINRNIDSVNYNSALNTASINANTTAQTQKILDAISGNRMADMQNQINQLQLQNAMSGVIRFPNSWTYGAGQFPPLFPPCPNNM